MATLFTLLFLWALAASLPDAQESMITASSLFMGLLAYESALLMPVLALPLLWMLRKPLRRSLGLIGSWMGVVVVHFAWRSVPSAVIVNDYGASVLLHAPIEYVANIPKVLGRLFAVFMPRELVPWIPRIWLRMFRAIFADTRDL